VRLRVVFAAALFVLTGCGEAAKQPPTLQPEQAAQTATPADEPETPTPAMALPPPKLQLPDTVTPLAYQLDLTVIPDRETFSGRVRIDARFDTASDGFWIHGRGLDVDAVELRTADAVVAASYRQVTGDGVARVSLAHPIEPQTAQLDIRYHGRFSDLLAGLFRVEVDGAWYAFTLFEPIDARGAFPGFDEPRFKTPFTLSIVAPKSATVAANTPIREIATLPDGTQRVQFETTPPLPTYLLAFAVGPLDVLDAAQLRGGGKPLVPLRGLAAKGRGAQFSYALTNTPEIVSLLEGYFAQPYPFAKLDLVAVPSQQTAMENPGLVTYSEYEMLLGDNPPLNQQRAFADVHAHELAHQWFGNSVTMPWWDDLWLNEAFATFMSSKIVQAWRPSYRAADLQVQSALAVMGNDSLATARRIREPIKDVNDITNAFDGITYEKGAAVLNMLEGFIGETQFRDGVRAHLRAHAGGSADMSDMVAALVEASGRGEIGGIMKTFTELAGTPLIDVKVKCGDQPPSVTLSQRRYLPVGSKAEPAQRWHVPVCMRIGSVDGVREQCVVLTEPSMEFPLDGIDGCPTWLMPNRGGRGYYRWHVDDTRLERLTSVMYSALDPGERLALADSLVSGAEAGGVDLGAFFQRVPLLLEGGDRYLLMSPVPFWRKLQVHVLDEAGAAASRARMRQLYSPVLSNLVKRGITSDEDRLTQSALTSLLALDARDPQLRAELTRSAQAFVGFGGDGQLHRDRLDVNLVPVALRVAVQDAGPKFATDLAARLNSTDDSVLRYALLGAIAAADDAALAQQLALDDSIRGDDFITLVVSMFGPERAERSWPWFAANIDALIEKSPTFERSFLIGVTGNFCADERAAEVAALFEPRLGRIDGGRRELDQTIEAIGLCAALRREYAASAHALFH
jgi:alanyl aminopeptidase